MPQPGLFNPSGLAISIATHLTVLTVGLGYAAVRPFETAPVETIAVELVSPEEVKQGAPETAKALPIPDPAVQPQSAAASQPSPPAQQQAAEQPTSAASPVGAATPPPSATAAHITPAAWRPPEPDLTVKYQINLGLPARVGEDFDAPAFAAAKVTGEEIAKFRERLKSCSVLPDSVSPTDKVTIRLRASFLPDGALAAAPLLIEASASSKGPLLMRAAIDALERCQPFAVLPANRYSEWKVLDLSFTPQDFRRS